MKIAIDCRPLQDASKNRGIGSYLRNLIPLLGSKHNYILFTDISLGDESLSFDLPQIKFKATRRQSVGSQVVDFLADNGIDHFHFSAQYNIWKRFNFPYSITVHDLMPLPLIDYSITKKIEFILAKRSYEKQLSKAKKLIAISKHTKKDIIKYTSVESSRIQVIYNGLDSQYLALKKEQATSQLLDSIKKPYIFFVGSFEHRKNFKRIVKAFLRFNKCNHYTLVAAIGHAPITPPHIRWAIGLRAKEVKLIRVITDTDIRTLYSHASVFFFPTLYEGFGLPVLEAMAENTPVITSDTSSLPEVGLDAAHYVDPHAVSTMTKALHKVTKDYNLRTKMIEKGKTVVSQFSYETCAKEMDEFFSDL